MKITIKDIQESPEKFYQMLVASQAELASYKLKYANLLEEIRLAKQYRFGSSSEKNISQSDLFDEPGVELPEEVKEQLSDEIEVRSYIRKKHPARRPLAYSDETTVQVLKDPNKGVQSKKYMWMFAGGAPNKFCFYYRYHHSRSHDVALDFFEGYKGYIHCDGFPGYDTLAAKSAEIKLSGCLYHASRKFVEIIKVTQAKEGVAHDVLLYITKLAKIEDEIKALNAKDKFNLRLEKPSQY